MKRLIFLSVILLIFVGQLTSQDFGYRKSWALIIGINEYQSLPRLTGAVKSAKMVREKLVREFGFDPENVIELYDDQATRENILKAFDRLMDPRRISKDDRVFIFFAGHGVTRTIGGKEKGYIMPVDGVMEKFASTAISTDQLHEFQEAIPAKHLFYVMDACYSGTIFTRGIGLRSELFTSKAEAISKFTSRKTRVAITAGSKDEQVVDLSDQGISVFTFYFLRGLDGDADVDRDEIITSSELADYVAKNVRFRAPQNPQYGRLPGDEDGEFIFMRVIGQVQEPKPTPPTPIVVEEPKQRPKPVQRKPAEETKKVDLMIQQPKNAWIYAFVGGGANIHDIKEEDVNFTKKEGVGGFVGLGFEYIAGKNFSVGINVGIDDKAGNFKI
ncbi:Caspase domain-containing protein, partial [Candidatus Thermokryptus mobilis]